MYFCHDKFLKLMFICSFLFFRGFVFITYEVLSLKKLLQIDTQAIHQEKLKSYVYVRTTSLNQNEYQGKMHNCLDF